VTDKEKIKSKLREFKLTSFAVDNATSVFLLTAMILLFGLRSYNDIPKEQFPEISFPQVFVNTVYFGNSAEDIENLITRPLEKEIQSVDGLKELNSTNLQDYSVIIAEFESDVDIDNAVDLVKDAVDLAKSELPSDLKEDPVVEDINFSELPIMTVNLSGNFNNDELRDFAEYLEDELEDINQISEVDIKGALEREVKVDVDLTKMASMKVSFGDIENAVASENLNMSGGEMVNDNFRRAIRVVGEFESVEELGDMIVKAENGNAIFLRDIADVNYGFKERTSYARSDQFPVVSVDVIKKKGANLLEASDNIKKTVKQAKEAYFPEDLKVSIFNDQSINTRNEVSNLENSIISGVLLVVLVLLFFLGLRNASFVGLAIPLSMLLGILGLYLMGYTMNTVVLFSLILALGLLVDNAIVVVENIYRYMQEGYNSKDAAKFGASEVAQPIIASTATTLAAFIPLAFWPGLVGSFMKFLPITLIFVLTASLFVALVINPVFTSQFMTVDERADDLSIRKKKRKNILRCLIICFALGLLFLFLNVVWLRNIFMITGLVSAVNFFLLRPSAFAFQNQLLPQLERFYDTFIRFALKKRNSISIFFGTFLLLIFALGLLGIRAPKVVFFPQADPLYINAFVEMPMGTDIEQTNEVVKKIEADIQKVIEPYNEIVDDVLTQIGEDTADPNGPPEPGASPNRARITVAFVTAQEREGVSTFKIMEEIRSELDDYTGVQIVVDKNQDGPPTGKPINLEIKGENIDQLTVLAEEIRTYINRSGISGIEELQTDVKLGKPELLINVNRVAARRFGVSTYMIADAIRTSVFGKEVSKFKVGEDEYPIMVRLKETSRNDVSDLLNQKITFRNPMGQLVQVPISTVADIEYSSTYSSIKRKDLNRMITIYSNVLQSYNANEVVAQIKDLMTEYDLPPGFSYEFTGEQQQQAEDMEFLSTAFLVALFVIFIIIVAQFNSVTSPFIIILSVLFSTIGVFLGYFFANRDIVVIMTGVGIISLAGVVVNNAIVLIDYTMLLIRQKKDEKDIPSEQFLDKESVRESIIQAGSTRLRPVLLTAITTVLGLVPLAIGFNFNFFTLITETDPQVFIGGDNVAFWGPMAWTVIYGLVFATFLTLVVVPVMVWLNYNIQRSVKKMLGKL